MSQYRMLLHAATVLIVCLSVAMPGQSEAEDLINNAIQGGHSGTWFDPAEPGHGLFVEVLVDNSSPTGKEVVVAWFAYFNNRPIWLLGQGDVVKDDEGYSVMLDMSLYDGNDFPPNFDPDSVERTPWGSMLLSFTGCDKAEMSWSSDLAGYGAGELNLRRLSTIAESRCIPDLAGQGKEDDHGDDWTTATYLTDIGSQQIKLTAKLDRRGDVDVFVFTVDTPVDFRGYTFGPDDVKTRAELYKIDDYEEDLVASSDIDEPFMGFDIEESLGRGTYSVHIMGKSTGNTGTYNFYYRARAR